MTLQKMILILPLVAAITACTTSQDEILPTGDLTMKEIWQQGSSGGQPANFEARNALQFVRPIDSAYAYASENAQYTRTALNETTNLFPRLPNPDLVMYVFPHLTDTVEPVPVPGYTTVFPFYGRVQYAQPGERTRDY